MSPVAVTLLFLLALAVVSIGCGTPKNTAQAADDETRAPARGVGAAATVKTPTPIPRPSITPAASRVLSSTNQIAELSAQDSKYLVNGDKASYVAQAQAELFREGSRFYLIIVSSDSISVQAEIYTDMLKRFIRATTGPDEGIDTRELECHPYCVFVPEEAENVIGVASWKSVLKHEQRHMVQAANNPEMARAVRRSSDNVFTTYAAFLEACADDGIFVAEVIYHASVRMPLLKSVLGAHNNAILDRACQGFPDSFRRVAAIYELKQGKGSFMKLFPEYR